MGRINLKKLKDALNGLSGYDLENIYMTHKMAIEDGGEAKMGVVFYADEEDFEKYQKLFETEEYEVLKEFIETVEKDCKKVAICLIDEDKMEDYEDDCE